MLPRAASTRKYVYISTSNAFRRVQNEILRPARGRRVPRKFDFANDTRTRDNTRRRVHGGWRRDKGGRGRTELLDSLVRVLLFSRHPRGPSDVSRASRRPVNLSYVSTYSARVWWIFLINWKPVKRAAARSFFFFPSFNRERGRMWRFPLSSRPHAISKWQLRV